MAIKFLNSVNADSGVLYVDAANDRVGIGTASPAYDLDVSGNSRTTGTILTSNGTLGTVQYGASSYNIQGGSSVGDLRYTAPRHRWYEDTNFIMTIDGGNVGIGTASPSTKLDVSGVITATGGSSTNWNTAYGWGNHASAGYLTSYTETQTLDDVTTLGSTTTNNISVGPSFLVGASISTAPAYLQLGSGRTASGYAYIDLVGDTTYTDYGLRIIRYNGGANTASDIVHRGTGQFSIISIEAAPILFKTSATERMRIDSSGNVGIGTTSPSTKLEVLKGSETIRITGSATGNAFTGWMSFVDSAGTRHGYVGYGSTGDDNLIINSDGGSLRLRAGNTDTAYVTSTGIGIGTTSPSTKLQTGDGSAGMDTAIRAYHSDGAYTEIRGYGLITNRTTAYIRPAGDKNATMAIGNDNNTWNNVNVNANTFTVGTDTTEHMRITSAGNVGIGTTSPASKLTVVDAGNTLTFAQHSTSNIAELKIIGDAAHDAAIYFGDTVDNVRGGFYYDTSANQLQIRGYNNGTRMVVNSNGYIGVGTTSPSEKLEVSGNILASGDITAFSDARIKENIETLPNALESVKAMRGVTYNKIGEEKQSIGVIAQELQSVMPQLVAEHNDGMLSVAYGNITAVLIEAIKEQQDIISQLEERIIDLENRL